MIENNLTNAQRALRERPKRRPVNIPISQAAARQLRR
jgi:hypothetical protein